jgi:hypothetical protein
VNLDRDASLVATEQLLLGAARSLEYPSTPNMSMSVVARLHSDRELAKGAPLPGLAAAAAAAMVAVLGVALVVPASRTAMAKFLGLDSVRVEVEPSVTALPTIPLDVLGSAVTLMDAQERLGFQLALPDGREADVVYLIDNTEGPAAAVLVYQEEGFELWETRRLQFGKGVGMAAFVHEVVVSGEPGIWIEPGHTAYLEEAGLRTLRRGVDRGVLLWEQDGTTYRLEIADSQNEAIAIAESLR